MSKLRKRDQERKGENKQKIMEGKLSEGHLEDLTKKKVTADELLEEEY